jgi:ADP-ribosyl-[dinitrogen reductase] hydrolase
MLLELAIGDAYRAGFEYVSSKLVREHNDLSHYAQHPRHTIRPGCYTDDAQMSIAIAELIVSDTPWEPLQIANKFVEVFKRDPREGYAREFRLSQTGRWSA